MIQCDQSADIENKTVLLVFVGYLYEEDIYENMLCVLLLPKNTTVSELFKSLNDYFPGKLNWSFCVSVGTDGATAMIGRLSGLTVQIKKVASEYGATHCGNHREMLASLIVYSMIQLK